MKANSNLLGVDEVLQTHGHHHSAPKDYNLAFIIGTVLNVGFVLVEAGFGLATQSLALLADAAHNLSDVMGLLLAWGAFRLGKVAPTQRYTYGLRRSSILAALVNSILLLLAMGAIIWEALRSFDNDISVAGSTLIWVAGIGVVINGLTAWLFAAGRQHDINIKGAFLHMLADALVSLGVVLAGIVILATGWGWVDPVMSLIIAAVIITGTWQLLRDALNMALDAVPSTIEPAAVRTFLAEYPGVASVHDLHIWAMSTTETALTAHLLMPDGHPGDWALQAMAQSLKHNFGIQHTTVQVELGNGDSPCPLEPDEHV
jgi:cobalt-zinc-cadmium efflux system protein